MGPQKYPRRRSPTLADRRRRLQSVVSVVAIGSAAAATTLHRPNASCTLCVLGLAQSGNDRAWLHYSVLRGPRSASPPQFRESATPPTESPAIASHHTRVHRHPLASIINHQRLFGHPAASEQINSVFSARLVKSPRATQQRVNC